MAETYAKGTRVWFPDKDLGWISAEVTSAVRSGNDALKLTFVDDRGKVRKVCYRIAQQLARIQSVFLF